ncbi:MAG: gluconate 2-dehydrogenase subunit 3 family protein [Bacteroidetes bacterium]|nr:gluconate 2-dehydrogenase subunit 3 family protein [Bacteroidota bacterium]MBS1931737.1 gluconate 2-dehydrogenase subunit 3 family protein [Bacteroidota bacterium]
MDRRKSLKLIATGAVAVPAVIAACNTEEKKTTEQVAEPTFNLDRYPAELKHEKELLSEGKFFTPEEMATITILADIIIPKDEVSGSASDAKVPGFIEFIVKDMPEHQVPLRGGLRWLDVECMKRYEKSFKDCSKQQQIEMVDDIAYPERKLKPGMSQGVKFFNRMRDLTATGFYTSEIGVKDLDYKGNQPNQWNGVPDDVLKQYGLAYTEKEMKECVKF